MPSVDPDWKFLTSWGNAKVASVHNDKLPIAST